MADGIEPSDVNRMSNKVDSGLTDFDEIEDHMQAEMSDFLSDDAIDAFADRIAREREGSDLSEYTAEPEGDLTYDAEAGQWRDSSGQFTSGPNE